MMIQNRKGGEKKGSKICKRGPGERKKRGRKEHEWGEGRRQRQLSVGHSRLICSCQSEGFPSSRPYLCCPPGCWCQTERRCVDPASAPPPSPGTDRVAALHCNPVIMSIKGLENGARNPNSSCKEGKVK